jgi:putative dimethyl sulfoxide reductase chaperone
VRASFSSAFEAAAARQDLCRFLAACYYQPGPEFAEEKLFESMLAASTRVDPQLATHAQRMAEEFAAAGHERLLLDYTRLFLGPNEVIAHPYESVWIGNPATVMGKSTDAVLELYRAGGYDIDEGFRDLPDHVACELEFLYLLLFRENQARAQEDGDAGAAAMALRRRLLDEHLGAWIGPFTAAIAGGAQSAFYRELAALTGRFVGLETARLR